MCPRSNLIIGQEYNAFDLDLPNSDWMKMHLLNNQDGRYSFRRRSDYANFKQLVAFLSDQKLSEYESKFLMAIMDHKSLTQKQGDYLHNLVNKFKMPPLEPKPKLARHFDSDKFFSELNRKIHLGKVYNFSESESKNLLGRLKRYDLSVVQFLELWHKAEGKCEICTKELKMYNADYSDRSVIDHCHKTTKVRGILCAACNLEVGRFERSQKTTQNDRIIRYLQRIKE